MKWLVISRLLSLSDDNEGSSSDTAPLFQMAGDGRSTDDITMPLLFLFHKEGNILLEALKEYREVEVLLSDKARDRGGTLSRCFLSLKVIISVSSSVWIRAGWMWCDGVTAEAFSYQYCCFSSISLFSLWWTVTVPFLSSLSLLCLLKSIFGWTAAIFKGKPLPGSLIEGSK